MSRSALLDQIVPSLVHQAAGLQGKEEEAGDKEVLTSPSDGKKLADMVHLAGGKGIFQRYSIIIRKKDRN